MRHWNRPRAGLPAGRGDGAKAFVVGKGDVDRLLRTLSRRYQVWGPVRKGRRHVLDRLAGGCADLDYTNTDHPASKLFLPTEEVLFRFRDGQLAEETIPSQGETVALFGVRPCDVRALGVLDRLFKRDPYYRARRGSIFVAVLNCSRPGPECFCLSVGGGPALDAGYDLAMTDIGEAYVVEAGTRAGEETVRRSGLRKAAAFHLEEREQVLRAAVSSFTKGMRADAGRLMEKGTCHPVWSGVARECLGCGACTAVCPTCFCYAAADRLGFDLRSGTRVRTRDSCLRPGRALIAGGHNFREERTARIRHRVYHKVVYHRLQFGTPGCVGCGRCIRACIKGIDMTAVVQDLASGVVRDLASVQEENASAVV